MFFLQELGRAGADSGTQGRHHPQRDGRLDALRYLKRGSRWCTRRTWRGGQLWQTSGHEGYYAQNMFDIMELDDGRIRMKPMNCPFHILIYKDSLKSYRDLPVRLGELGRCIATNVRV